MLKVEIEYETPIESNCYQNEGYSSYRQEPDNKKDPTEYTPHKSESNSKMNNHTKMQQLKNTTKSEHLDNPNSFRKPEKKKHPITRS